MGIYDRDWYRQSPRHLAGWYSEADPDARDDRGFTPLRAAVRPENPAVARLLLEQGTRVTPDLLDLARESPGGQEMVDLLRQYRKAR
jgi:hypothetical protein